METSLANAPAGLLNQLQERLLLPLGVATHVRPLDAGRERDHVGRQLSAPAARDLLRDGRAELGRDHGRQARELIGGQSRNVGHRVHVHGDRDLEPAIRLRPSPRNRARPQTRAGPGTRAKCIPMDES